MDQAERRKYLVKYLLDEQPLYRGMEIPSDENAQKRLLRSLLNIRPPKPIGEDFLKIQDEYLKTEIAEKGITNIDELTPVGEDMYVWQGDITTLRCGAIVNAANSELLGCFYPCHGCIDNAIHTYSGIQLRLKCAEIMQKQGRGEPTGKAKLTPAYNLPCTYILHTVGPIVRGKLTKRDEELLASCYRSCLELADENGIESVAFCCISTGEFHFPNDIAAKIAVKTVTDYKTDKNSKIKVVFNVFKDYDRLLYGAIFG